MNGPHPSFPAFPKKGEGHTAFPSDQPAKGEGMVLPWLMTMPEPSEAMKIGSSAIQKRAPSGNHIPDEANVNPCFAA